MKKRDSHNSALYKLWKNMMYSIQHFVNSGKRRRLIYYCSDKTRQDTVMNVVLCLMVGHLKTVALRKA